MTDDEACVVAHLIEDLSPVYAMGERLCDTLNATSLSHVFTPDWTQVDDRTCVVVRVRAVEGLEEGGDVEGTARMPGKHPHRAYDYHECRDYLQARDGYDERDYAGTFAGHPEAPYQDFWHFVLDRGESHINNQSLFTMAAWWGEGAEPWQQEILAKYLDTFGEDDASGKRCIDFYVAW